MPSSGQAFFTYRVRVISRKPILASASWIVLFIRVTFATVATVMMAIDGVLVVMAEHGYLIDVTMGLAILMSDGNVSSQSYTLRSSGGRVEYCHSLPLPNASPKSRASTASRGLFDLTLSTNHNTVLPIV
jgi:hypothetical protein